MNRRSILKVIGLSPLAARAAEQEAVMKASRMVGTFEQSGGAQLAAQVGIPANSLALPEGATPTAIRTAFLFPNKRAAIESILFEEAREVLTLDFDLANSRALSLAAKITYQRQRNVKRQMERMSTDNWWSKTSNTIAKIVGGL